jgi:hypothetical protein
MFVRLFSVGRCAPIGLQRVKLIKDPDYKPSSSMSDIMYIKIAIFWAATVFAFTLASAGDKDAKQTELDNACEAQRQIKIAPLREKSINECVEAEGKERDYCERYYQDYGNRSGDRPALFYDLPECVAAFEYQKNKQLH